MALFVICVVLFSGYSLGLGSLGLLTGLAVGIAGMIMWEDKKHPSPMGKDWTAIGLFLMSVICTWLVAILVRVLNAPPFPWHYGMRALAWFCRNLLFR